jgi:aminomethyltransferase
MKKFDETRRRDHEQIRRKVGIADFTMGLLEITGSGARAFLDEICVNDLAGLGRGHIIYTSLLNEQAKMIDDVTVFCFGDQRFWMVTAWPDSTLVWLEEHRGSKAVSFENLGDQVSLLTVQGPDSRRLLVSYLDIDITSMKYYTFMENRAGGIPVIVSRTGFTGELGFEIFADKARVEAVLGDLLRCGKRFGSRLITSDVTMESLPTEKGLLLKRDFDGANPLEMGLGWSVKWDKHFFIGQEKLLEIKEKGVSRRLKGFICRDNDEVDIENGSPVLANGRVIGRVTTANYGYTVGGSIGYCLLEVAQAVNGAEVTIASSGRPVTAEICDRVFYDLERIRVNAEITELRVPDMKTEEFINGGRVKKFGGVFAAMPTPFLRDENLDHGALRKLINFLADASVDGILVGGSSGEYPVQTVNERKELFRASAEAANGRLKIAACCSTNNTRDTKDLCAYSGEVGLDFALIMTPFDPPITEAGLVAYYQELANYSKPGIIIYHYPSYTNVQLSTEAVVELSRAHNIVGLKDVADLTNTVPIITETRGQDFGVVTGTDYAFLGAMACGADGFMGVAACVAPKLCRDLFDKFNSGDIEAARQCHRKIVKIMKVVFDGPFPGTLKEAMRLQGLDCGRPRKPSATVDFLGRRILQNVLAETGII